MFNRAYIVIGFVTAIALLGGAQMACAEPVIIACEGPNMPAACPPQAAQNTPQTMDAQRQAFLARQTVLLEQQQQIAAQHQGLGGQLYQAWQAGAARQQAEQPTPLNPLFAPPNIKASAQIVGGILSGNATPH